MRANSLGLLVILGGCFTALGNDAGDLAKSNNRLDLAKDFLHKHQLEAAETECDRALALSKANDEAFVVRGLVHMLRAIDTQRTMEIDGCLTGIDAEATRR